MVRVAVVALSGAVLLEEDLPGDCSVGELKAKLQPRCGVVANEQQLARGSDILDDGSFLGDLAEEALCLTFVRSLTRMVLSGGRDRKLSLWDLNRSEADCDFEGHAQAVRCLEVDWQSQRALSGSADASLRLWDLARGGHLQLCGHDDSVECLSVCWDTNFALSASLDRSLRMWNVLSGEVTTELLDCLQSLTTGRSSVISGDWARQRLLSAGEDSMLHLRDAFRRGQCIGHLEGHTDAVLCVSVDWASTRALSGSSDRRLVLWDMAEWKSLRTFHGHRDAVRCLSVDWAKGQALSGSFDRTLLLWDLENEKALASLEGHRDWVCCVCCHWPGRKALSGGREGALKLWDLDTASCMLTLEGHPDAVWSVALNLTEASAGRALSAGRDRQLRLWCLAEGRLLRCLAGHQDAVRSLDVDWASQQVLSCGFDNVLRLWNLESSEHIQEFEGHTRGFISTIKLTFGEPSRAFHPTNRCDLLQRGLDLGHGGIWRRRQHGAALGHFRRR
ncbi:unnamed protein product [Effrenium voratum]|nr:unnamed protein product [Effrenium voratum]